MSMVSSNSSSSPSASSTLGFREPPRLVVAISSYSTRTHTRIHYLRHRSKIMFAKKSTGCEEMKCLFSSGLVHWFSFTTPESNFPGILLFLSPLGVYNSSPLSSPELPEH